MRPVKQGGTMHHFRTAIEPLDHCVLPPILQSISGTGLWSLGSAAQEFVVTTGWSFILMLDSHNEDKPAPRVHRRRPSGGARPLKRLASSLRPGGIAVPVDAGSWLCAAQEQPPILKSCDESDEPSLVERAIRSVGTVKGHDVGKASKMSACLAAFFLTTYSCRGSDCSEERRQLRRFPGPTSL